MSWTGSESSQLLIEVFKNSPNTLVPALLECFLEIIKTSEDGCHNRKFIEKWLGTFEVVKNIPSIDLVFEEESKWVSILIKILKPYKKGAIQFTEQDAEVIQQTLDIIETWHSSKIKVPKKVTLYVAYVTYSIDKGM